MKPTARTIKDSSHDSMNFRLVNLKIILLSQVMCDTVSSHACKLYPVLLQRVKYRNRLVIVFLAKICQFQSNYKKHNYHYFDKSLSYIYQRVQLPWHSANCRQPWLTVCEINHHQIKTSFKTFPRTPYSSSNELLFFV